MSALPFATQGTLAPAIGGGGPSGAMGGASSFGNVYVNSDSRFTLYDGLLLGSLVLGGFIAWRLSR